MTPFGSPVLPLEKMMVARSSSVLLRAEPSALSIHDTGKQSAIKRAASFSPTPGSAATVSINTVSTGSFKFNLVMNFSDVTTRLMPHWLMQEASASADRV